MRRGPVRSRGLAWHDRLFFILLAISIACYGVSRFLQIRFFALPAMVIMAPRSLLGRMFVTMGDLRRENQRLSDLSIRQELDNGFWRDQAGAAAHDSLSNRYMLKQAAIVGRDPQSLVRVMIVDKGLLSGVRANMPAITDAGVAGKVIEAGANLSFVATILNPRVRLAALDLRSRVNGVAGFREGDLMNLDYVMPDQDVAAGDTVVTSGTGGVFPKGLPIGTVVRADSAPRGMFRPVVVRPFVNVAALENVYLIEDRDWSQIEARRREAADELQQKEEADLKELLNESRIEAGGAGTPRTGQE